MKRIAYLCLSDAWGGLEMNQLRNAQFMQERGHRVVLIANAKSAIASHAQSTNIPLYIVKQKPKHYQWIFAWRLMKYLKRYDFQDLIFRNNREQSIAASVAFFSAQKIKTHYFMEMALGGKRTQFFRTRRYALIDTWICPLPYLKDQVLAQTKVAPNKIREIPSGLFFEKETKRNKEKARQQLAWPTDQYLIVMAGRIDPKKRQHFVWESFSRRSNDNEQLIFVGEPTVNEPTHYFEKLKAKIGSHPKNEQVIWQGFEQNMALVYQAADLVVMAASHETVGMATLEALQYNCPVVAVNNGGGKAIIETFGGGLLFEEDSEESFSNCIDEVRGGNFPVLQQSAFEQHFDFNRVCSLVEAEILRVSTVI